MEKLKVETHFGEKELTREEYVKRWIEHTYDLGHLCDKREDFTWYGDLQTRVKEMAGAQFDRNLARQKAGK